MSLAFNSAPPSISRTPKLTFVVAAVAAGAIAATAVLAQARPRATPIYLAAPAAVAAVPGDGDARSAVLFSADGRSKITITVEDVAAAPASAPSPRGEFSPEAEIRHASSRP